MHPAYRHTMTAALLWVTISISILTSCARARVADDAVMPTETPVMTIASDISNRRVTAMAEDAQGHIWIGTFRGLNKYDSYEYHQYFCVDDTSGLPDNQINALHRDAADRLWVATIAGPAVYTDNDRFERVAVDGPTPNCHTFLTSHDGRLIMADNFRVYVLDPARNTFVTLFDIKQGVLDNTPASYYIDRYNHLWCITDSEARCYDIDTREMTHRIDLPAPATATCAGGSGSHLWIVMGNDIKLLDTYKHQLVDLPIKLQTHPLLRNGYISLIHRRGENSLFLYSYEDGLFYADLHTGRVLHQSDVGFPFMPPKFRINCIFSDSQNNLWLGSYDQGVAVRYNYNTLFNNDRYVIPQLRNKTVVATASDNDGNLIISTLMDGLYVYNTRTHAIHNLPLSSVPHLDSGIGRGVSAILVDRDGDIWMASLLLNKVIRYRWNGSSLVPIKSFDVPRPLNMSTDARGNIVVGQGINRLSVINRATGLINSVNVGSDCFVTGTTLLPDSSMMVVAFRKPLMQLTPDQTSVRPISIDTAQWHSCIHRSGFIPTCVLHDSYGKVWIGTVGNGLLRYDPTNGTIERIEGAPCTDIAAITEDRQGNLWVSTQYGLGRYDRTRDRFTNYYDNDGTGGNQFFDRATCMLSDGSIVFGGTHGLTMFNPVDMRPRRTVPLVFEDLKIHNQLINAAEHPEIIDSQLATASGIHLAHDQNSFSISFAALGYNDRESANYVYCLEGHDNYWVDARQNREANYTNVPPGDYTFRVRLTENNSISGAEIAIPVTIDTAPWLSWWAWLIYCLLAALLIWQLVRAQRHVRHQRRITQRAILEKEQEKRNGRMNMSFFANISHEFRTPLTMISGPLNQLRESPDIKGNDRDLIGIIQHSVNRMLRLVNQLMDFNKLENDTLRLQVERNDVIGYLRGIVRIFTINANNKGVTLTTEGLEDSFVTLIDADKLDKIVNNLLSNAVKFTPSGGSIALTFDVVPGSEALASAPKGHNMPQSESFIKITVSDTGAGIPTEYLESVFERYFQLTRSKSGNYNWGTGIGLYYARALAALHHGWLYASERPDGLSGTVMTLLIPIGDNIYSDDEHVMARSQAELPAVVDLPNESTTLSSDGNPDRPTLLLVDDDDEVITYLRTLLSSRFNLLTAFDANKAFEIASAQHPDLIISDVVMPGTDGYELCRRIKADMQICHTPVILVTAKATIENQVEGLTTGADAYVTKPFDPKYLIALINSQLSNRAKARQLLSTSTETATIEPEILSGTDKAFMDELYDLMSKELSNSELDVTHITEMLRISRTKFYYKVKGLTGTSPSAFFKTYKLNRAAELIASGQYTITEIADMTGFSTVAHFSTSFKKQFGVSPSAWTGSMPEAQK